MNTSQANAVKESPNQNLTQQHLNKTRRHKPVAPQMDSVVFEESAHWPKHDLPPAEVAKKLGGTGRNFYPTPVQLQKVQQ